MTDERIADLLSPDPARARGVLEDLLATARASRDREGEALVLLRLARNAFEQGDLQASDELYRQAGQCGHGGKSPPVLRARAIQGRADVALERGQLDEAFDGYRRAGKLHASTGQEDLELGCLLGAARASLARGETERAVEAFWEVRGRSEELGVPLLMADVDMVLGGIAETNGRLDAAVGLYGGALLAAQQAGDRGRVGNCLGMLAGAFAARGDLEAAEETARAALLAHRELGQRDHEALDLWTLGDVLEEDGRADEARHALEEARMLYAACGLREQEAAVAEQLTRLGRSEDR